MSNHEEIFLLTTHRDNLAKAETWEEYRNHHIAYIDYLIERQKGIQIHKDAATKFVYREADVYSDREGNIRREGDGGIDDPSRA